MSPLTPPSGLDNGFQVPATKQEIDAVIDVIMDAGMEAKMMISGLGTFKGSELIKEIQAGNTDIINFMVGMYRVDKDAEDEKRVLALFAEFPDQDKPLLANDLFGQGKTWSARQIADEIRQKTPFGIERKKSMLREFKVRDQKKFDQGAEELLITFGAIDSDRKTVGTVRGGLTTSTNELIEHVRNRTPEGRRLIRNSIAVNERLQENRPAAAVKPESKDTAHKNIGTIIGSTGALLMEKLRGLLPDRRKK